MKTGARKKQYLMRVDELLWRRTKSKAALEGITMREAIERLFLAWLDGRVDIKKHERG